MIDSNRGFTLAGGGTHTPNLKAGVREDGSDAETGFGFELSKQLRYQGDSVSIESNVRTLVTHSDDAYEERSASASVRIDPGSDGRGMSRTVAPTWGSTASRAEHLRSTRTAEDLVSDSEFEGTKRPDAEIGYGVGGPDGWGTLTPYGGLTLAGGAGRTLRTGLRWKAADSATVALEGTREAAGAAEAATNALRLRAAVRF